jgi:hypothetical protein
MSLSDVALESSMSSACRRACAHASLALASTNCAVWSTLAKSIDTAVNVDSILTGKDARRGAGTARVTAPLTMRPL